MLTLEPFAWRKLSPASHFEHRLAEDGTIRLRGLHPDEPPFRTILVDRGRAALVEEVLNYASRYRWTRAADRDGWIFSVQVPDLVGKDIARLEEAIGKAAIRDAADPLGVDERFALITAACASWAALCDLPDEDGYVKAPRTSDGYPARKDDEDPGDFRRDAEDWKAGGGMHSAHGLMQTRIGVAKSARPDLFEGVDPALHRTVLWKPKNSLACGLARLAHVPREVLADPLACRFKYADASADGSDSNMWGVAPAHDDLVALSFLAHWNAYAFWLALVAAKAKAKEPRGEVQGSPAPPAPVAASRPRAREASRWVLGFLVGATTVFTVAHYASTSRVVR
jgi:hypothetical protein